MKKVRIAKWLVEADSEATQAATQRSDLPCDCLSCRNYRKAVVGTLWFEELGIDIAYPDLLSDFPADSPDKRLYIGHYEIAGRLLEGPLTKNDEWEEAVTATVGDFTIGFSDADGLRLEFEAVLPWRMDEPQED